MTNDISQVVQFINVIMSIFLKAPITCIGSIVLGRKRRNYLVRFYSL